MLFKLLESRAPVSRPLATTLLLANALHIADFKEWVLRNFLIETLDART